MATREIKVRVIPPLTVGSYAAALNESPLAAGFDAGTRARGLDRLALAIAESALEDAQADAAALKANRDLLAEELRASRLALNEAETLLTAARHVGRDQLREIGEAHAELAAANAMLRGRGREIDRLEELTKDVSARIDAKVAERVGDLVQRIDVYQCELAGLHADRDAAHALLRRVRRAVIDPHAGRDRDKCRTCKHLRADIERYLEVTGEA